MSDPRFYVHRRPGFAAVIDRLNFDANVDRPFWGTPGVMFSENLPTEADLHEMDRLCESMNRGDQEDPLASPVPVGHRLSRHDLNAIREDFLASTPEHRREWIAWLMREICRRCMEQELSCTCHEEFT